MINVKRVAEAARINLSDDEVEKFEQEFEEILETFSELDEADTEGVKPSFHVIDLENVSREDVVEESLTQEQALKNTEHAEKGFFKGPRSV